MPDSVEGSLKSILNEFHRLTGLPPIAGGAPASAEYSLEMIQQIISNWTPSGGTPSPNLPTVDEKAALDAAPTPLSGANPVASMADVGGDCYEVKQTVLWSDFELDGAGGTIADHFYTIPAGTKIVAAGIRVTVPFDDSALAFNQPNLDLNERVSGQTLADCNFAAPYTDHVHGALSGLSNSYYINSAFGGLIIADSEAELLIRWTGEQAGDGTVGAAEMTLSLMRP